MKPDRSKVYDYRWRAIRKKFLSNYPLCVRCGHEATMIDHILPVFEGGTHDERNLQSICVICHGVKTRKDLRRRKPETKLPDEVVSVTEIEKKKFIRAWGRGS